MPSGQSPGSTAPIVVTQIRRVHILDGDLTGGGHGPGRGVSGKSEFPASLTDDEIISGILVIANDPACYPSGVIPNAGSRVRVAGQIRGVPNVVFVDPVVREVITAYPLGVARNP
jgi:hypothetical protein